MMNPPRPGIVLALVFLLSLPAVTVRLYSSDEVQHFAYLRSLWFDHDLSFDNEYRYFYERGIAQGARSRDTGVGTYGSGFHRTFLETTTETGLRINFAPIGAALLWAPFYIATDVGVRVSRAAGADIAADGFSRPYIAAVVYASAFYGFLSIVLSLVVCRRVLGRADWTVSAVWLGTPLLFYMYVAPGFAHATSAFVVAAFVLLWLHVRRNWSWKGAAGLGALAAIMGMVREQDVFMAIGPAVDYAVAAVRDARSGARSFVTSSIGAAVGVLVLAVCLFPQLLTYLTLYGQLGPSSLVTGKMDWTAPHAWQVLASRENGLLFWTPLALPALAGLVGLALGRVSRATADGAAASAWVGVVCLLMVASQIYVSGSVSTWTGSTFGQRRLVGLTVFFALGLASLFRVVRPAWARHGLAVVLAICTWWNLGLIAQFGTNLMDRQRLDLAQNAYHNVVTIPRMLPGLAYRYVFDRSSFYRPPPTP